MMVPVPRITDRPCRITNDAMKPLARTVAHFCGLLARLPDSEGSKARFVVCTKTSVHFMPSDPYEEAAHISQRLMDLGSHIHETRGPTVTSTQRSLQQLQHAYRGLQGLVIGVPDRLLDLQPGSAQRTIRDLLLTALHGSGPQALANSSGASAVHCACEPCRGGLSAIFESSERIQLALVEGLRDTPDLMRFYGSLRSGPPALIVNARLDRMRRHLLELQEELGRLLKGAGHRRTLPMRLAHGIFLALGHAEGAMIGAESQFENACRALMHLIAARTSELGRYC